MFTPIWRSSFLFGNEWPSRLVGSANKRVYGSGESTFQAGIRARSSISNAALREIADGGSPSIMDAISSIRSASSSSTTREDRPAIRRILLDLEMMFSHCRNLRQMRNDDDLMSTRQLLQFLPNHLTRPSANAHIDLVENQGRRVVRVREHRLERQHHARGFSARSHSCQRFRDFA